MRSRVSRLGGHWDRAWANRHPTRRPANIALGFAGSPPLGTAPNSPPRRILAAGGSPTGSGPPVLGPASPCAVFFWRFFFGFFFWYCCARCWHRISGPGSSKQLFQTTGCQLHAAAQAPHFRPRSTRVLRERLPDPLSRIRDERVGLGEGRGSAALDTGGVAGSTAGEQLAPYTIISRTLGGSTDGMAAELLDQTQRNGGATEETSCRPGRPAVGARVPRLNTPQ